MSCCYYLVVSSCQRIVEVVFSLSFYTCEAFVLVPTTNERLFEDEFINIKHTYLKEEPHIRFFSENSQEHWARIGQQVMCGSVYSYILGIRHYAPNTFSALPNLRNRRILARIFANTLCESWFSWLLVNLCENAQECLRISVFAYSLRIGVHSVSHKFWDCALKTTKKILKNSKQIFLFKVIVINCNTLVGAIFQPMHCSQKIGNRNSLQFRRYRRLNVAYGCILVPLQLHFQLQQCKIVLRNQIRRVRWIVKPFAWTTRCSHCSAINTCGTNRVHSFRFFKSSDRIWRTMVFSTRTLLYYPTTSTVVVFQNSCHPSDVFIHFHYPFPSAPLCVFNRLFTRRKLAVPLKYLTRDTDESPNAFTNIFHIFAAVNLALLQNFIAACCSKFFPW